MEKKNPDFFINFSVISAIKEINSESRRIGIKLAIKSLKENNRSDYDTALYLLKKINNLKKTNADKEIIKEIILFYKSKITFFKKLRYGTDNIFPLAPNQMQCLRNAGLLEKINGVDKIDDIKWWENLKNKSFEENDKRKEELGKYGHECSMEYEKLNLKSIGINEEPIAKYIENDACGYDVLSWRINKKKEKIKIYIESKAKAFSADSLDVDISETQLKKAKEFPDNYYIYLWPNARKWDFETQPKPRIYGSKQITNSKQIPRSYRITLKKADKIETI